MAEAPAGARTLLRGLALLECIATDTEGSSVTALSMATGLDKGTTSRLLATLREAGYIRQDPTDRLYRLTGKVLKFSETYRDQLDLRSIARPHLTRLRDLVDETVHLGVTDGEKITYIDKVESSQSIRLESRLGHQEPIYTTALGRAILSRVPAEDRRALVIEADLNTGARRSTLSRKDLLDLLDRAAELGYATEDEENRPEVTCAGSAIVDAAGRPIGAVSISGPSYRMAPRLTALGLAVRETARAVTDELAGVNAGAL
ncbi:IclR family transcriptional regulator [Rhodococcus sp. NPDC055112]